MKRSDARSVGDILRDLFRDNCMEQELNEQKAVGLWSTVVGENIASQCRRPFVSRGLMTVGVSNASLRHELTMTRSGIKDTLNKLLGKETINEIRFVT